MAVSSEQAVKSYLDRMSSGQVQEKYKAGIDRTAENPMAKAATDQSQQLYLQRVQESVSSGRRSQKLLAVPFQRWKDNAKNVGASRLSSGAQKAADKVRAHFQKWTPIYQQVSDTIRSMPKGTRADSAARAVRAMEMLMDAAGKA